MHSKQQFHSLLLQIISRAATAALAIFFALALTPVFNQPAWGQTFTVLHIFSGADGRWPEGSLTRDARGNLYGTTEIGGSYDKGTVFKLSQRNSDWILTMLYSFGAPGNRDESQPSGQLARDSSGVLYGATEFGGVNGQGSGTVFQLEPSPHAPAAVLTPWTETQLFDFGLNDGHPGTTDLTFDSTGNLYGTTSAGTDTCGSVYQLSRSNGGWEESTIYRFPCTGEIGTFPITGVTFDAAGNIYGTAHQGGAYGYGTVYQLTNSGSGWTATALYSFPRQDGRPIAGVIFDGAGNLYGATSNGGPGRGGVVFELSPDNGGWTYSMIYALTYYGSGSYYPGPINKLAIDTAGNLYGTAQNDPGSPEEYGDGSVFKLTTSYEGWTYTALHVFNADDGSDPAGSPVLDSNGNIYGTCVSGGYGLVWEIAHN